MPLRGLIQDWVEKNPDQAYVWEIRFTGFSGQRAEELERVAATGGLLAEAQRARETVDEVRVLAERTTYYLLRAPTLARLQAELAAVVRIGQARKAKTSSMPSSCAEY